MATKRAAVVPAGTFSGGGGGAQRSIDAAGDIWEFRGGEWIKTGLNEQQAVEVEPLHSFGAMAARGLSAPARLLGFGGESEPELYGSFYGQNPKAAALGSVVGAAPTAIGGGVLGAGASLARNLGIQAAMGAAADAEDPLQGALLQAGIVLGAGAVGKGWRAARGAGRAGPAAPAGAPARAAGSSGEPAAAGGMLPEQPAGTFLPARGSAPGGGGVAPGGGAVQRQMMGAGDELTPGSGAMPGDDVVMGSARQAADPSQLAAAKELGIYVDPGYRYGSDLLQKLQLREGVMSDAMAIGARRNQNVLAKEAGRAAGIEAGPINNHTLELAMQRTRNGFESVASETTPVPKAYIERQLSELLTDPMGNPALVTRLKRAPEELDGKQLGLLQSFIAKERFKFNKAGDLNMAEAYGRAHDDVLNVIERGLPAGSRGNFSKLRQEYHGQRVLDRPGVLGAGDTINPTSYYRAVSRVERASESLLRARKMSQLMHDMRQTLGNSGTAGRGRGLLGAGAGSGIGAIVGGPVGAALGATGGAALGQVAPAAVFAAYNRGAPMLMGLMQRGASGL